MLNKGLPPRIILWGGTGQAKVIRPIVEYYGSKIDAIIDDTPNLKPPFPDIKLYQGYEGFLEYMQDKHNEQIGFIVTIGNNKTGKNAEARIRISKMLKEHGLVPVSIIHPTAYIDNDVEIGEGVQISAGATIITKSKIGDYCIINTGANVDHECILEEGSEIDPNATLCGIIHIGKNSWVGANATILPRLKIGNNSVVGAGAVVTKDIPEKTIVAGNPARELYKISNSDNPPVKKMNSRLMAGPSITNLEREIVADALKEESWYGKRYDYVEKFEKEFAEFHNRKYALMTPNCTQAIYLLLLSLGIKEGDEVIIPECTWTGTVASVIYCKAIPVFCDIEEKNWCLDPKSVLKNITPKTKAIIAVDLYGNMPNMEELEKISKEHNIYLIEDSAEALGSEYKGIKAGKFGVGSVFSFHCTKTITTGEGGILLLDDDIIYQRAKFLRDCGRSETEPYKVLEPSLKHMPDNLHAALGYAQFLRLKELIFKKRWIFQKYLEKLKEIPDLQFNEDSKDVYNGVWATSIIFGKSHNMDKSQIIEKLERLGFPARPFFYPLSSLPAYSKYNTGSREKNPVAYDISSRGITLPSAFILKEKDIDDYCDELRKILSK